jgi:hypothetical protein
MSLRGSRGSKLIQMRVLVFFFFFWWLRRCLEKGDL